MIRFILMDMAVDLFLLWLITDDIRLSFLAVMLLFVIDVNIFLPKLMKFYEEGNRDAAKEILLNVYVVTALIFSTTMYAGTGMFVVSLIVAAGIFWMATASVEQILQFMFRK